MPVPTPIERLLLKYRDTNVLDHAVRLAAGSVEGGRARPATRLSIRYTERLAAEGVIASVGSRGDSYDNAMAESIIGPCQVTDDLGPDLINNASLQERADHDSRWRRS